jgi:hypothetical protein
MLIWAKETSKITGMKNICGQQISEGDKGTKGAMEMKKGG